MGFNINTSDKKRSKVMEYSSSSNKKTLNNCASGDNINITNTHFPNNILSNSHPSNEDSITKILAKNFSPPEGLKNEYDVLHKSSHKKKRSSNTNSSANMKFKIMPNNGRANTKRETDNNFFLFIESKRNQENGSDTKISCQKALFNEG